jgi:hypothetical protein
MAKKDEFISIRECNHCNPEVWKEKKKSVGPYPYKCGSCNSVTNKVLMKRR